MLKRLKPKDNRQQCWQVSFGYKGSNDIYRSNGVVHVFANDFEEAADTAKTKIPQLYECTNVVIYSVHHEGEKTILFSDSSVLKWQEQLRPKSNPIDIN